jgi:hypothetical protein
MKKIKDLSEEKLEERYDTVSEIFAENYKEEIQEMILDISNDTRVLTMEYCGYIKDCSSPRIARLAIEKAIELAMNDKETFNKMEESPF